MTTRYAQILEENDELRRQNEELRKCLEEKDAEIGSLRQQLEKLRQDLEKWKRGFTERRKRRTSRSERNASGTGKKPGRRAGHVGAQRAVPDRIDEEVHHDAPEKCDCGGEMEVTDETRSTIIQDIPPIQVRNVKHVAHVGRCKACGNKKSAPLPGDVATGRSIAQVQVGPNLQAMAVGLRYEQKTSLGNICAFFGQWCGVSITAGGISQMFVRLRDRSPEAYTEIETKVRSAPLVGADETGFRQNGVAGWCWLARTDKASLFRVDPSRAGHVIDEMLGIDPSKGTRFIGVVVSDFYSVYTSRTDLDHAYCGAHVIRETKKIAELQPCPETVEFRDRVRAFYEAGAEAQTSSEASARLGARVRLGHLISSTNFVAFPDIVRLQERLQVHKIGITRFLDDPNIPWHNNATERDMREVARFRAVTGGTRSDRGSLTVAHWMSVTQTRRKNGLPLGSFVRGVYEAHVHKTSPPSVFT